MSEVYGFDMHCDACGTVTSCSHDGVNHERPHGDHGEAEAARYTATLEQIAENLSEGETTVEDHVPLLARQFGISIEQALTDIENLFTEYKIDWTTVVFPANDRTTATNVYGYLILRAWDLDGARFLAEESLLDVDFFHPGGTYSASNRLVISGQMWVAEFPERMTSTLSELLPNLTADGFEFDTIEIVDVQVATEGGER